MSFRYRRSDGSMATSFPHAKGAADLDELAAFLDQADAVIPLIEVAEGDTDERVVAMRHDVDNSMEHAHKFARWEHDHGYRSSYFVLPTAWYYEEEAELANTLRLMHEMVEMGHEIGIHNNAVGKSFMNGTIFPVDGSALRAGWCEDAAKIMHEWLRELRGYGFRIVGSAGHGAGIENIDNNDLWGAGHELIDFGLEYEAYFLHRKYSHYVSDNHGRWRAPLEFVEGRQTHVLLHPCHWELS